MVDCCVGISLFIALHNPNQPEKETENQWNKPILPISTP
jgi:hypothetical protein